MGGSVIGHFAVQWVFAELEPFFHFFTMAACKFSVSVDTERTVDPDYRWSVIGHFAVRWVFAELEPFFHNGRLQIFRFRQHKEDHRPRLWGWVTNWTFCCRTGFCRVRAIFSFFHNGHPAINHFFTMAACKFSVSVDTERTIDPDYRGVSNWTFCCTTSFCRVRAIFSFFYNGRMQIFRFRWHREDHRPRLWGVSNWTFCCTTSFCRVRAIFSQWPPCH